MIIKTLLKLPRYILFTMMVATLSAAIWLDKVSNNMRKLWGRFKIARMVNRSYTKRCAPFDRVIVTGYNVFKYNTPFSGEVYYKDSQGVKYTSLLWSFNRHYKLSK